MRARIPAPTNTPNEVLNAHNGWHSAVFLLEREDHPGALAIYDCLLHHAASPGIALEMLDASGLLWRLSLDGVDTGGRWAALADAWAANDPTPWYVFNDLHAIMAFVGAGRQALGVAPSRASCSTSGSRPSRAAIGTGCATDNGAGSTRPRLEHRTVAVGLRGQRVAEGQSWLDNCHRPAVADDKRLAICQARPPLELIQRLAALVL